MDCEEGGGSSGGQISSVRRRPIFLSVGLDGWSARSFDVFALSSFSLVSLGWVRMVSFGTDAFDSTVFFVSVEIVPSCGDSIARTGVQIFSLGQLLSVWWCAFFFDRERMYHLVVIPSLFQNDAANV